MKKFVLNTIMSIQHCWHRKSATRSNGQRNNHKTRKWNKNENLCHGQTQKQSTQQPSWPLPLPLPRHAPFALRLAFSLTCVSFGCKTNRFTLEQHLFFRFISRVSISLCQLSAAAAAFNVPRFCFIFHTIRNATHVRHAPARPAPPIVVSHNFWWRTVNGFPLC